MAWNFEMDAELQEKPGGMDGVVRAAVGGAA